MKRHFASLLLPLVLASAALAVEVEGVAFPERTMLGDRELILNGAGLRKKFLFKVYVAGLYLEKRSQDGTAILATDQARGVRMHMLRDLEKNQLREALEEGVTRNTKGEKLQAVRGRLDKLYSVLPDLKNGEDLFISYSPGKGTTLTSKGKESITLEGKDFADALFGVWLGPEPVDPNLKKAMLGEHPH